MGLSSVLLTLAPWCTTLGWAEMARPSSMWFFIIKEVSSGCFPIRTLFQENTSVGLLETCSWTHINHLHHILLVKASQEATPESGVGDCRILTNMARRQEWREQDIEMWPFHPGSLFLFFFPFPSCHHLCVFFPFTLFVIFFSFQTFFPSCSNYMSWPSQ